MKRLLAIAVLLASAFAAGAQDQPLRPVLVDASGVIISPNGAALAIANRYVQMDSAFYDVITNTAAWTGAVAKANSALQPAGNLTGSMGAATTAVAIVVSGAALGATSLQPTGLTTNQAFITGAGTTNTMHITNGVVWAIN